MRIIAGEARSRTIEAPKGRDTRPTLDRVRENLFNILQMRVYGSRVLDLFSGSGALALEAVSRGAASAVMVDHDRAANLCEKKNAAALRFEDRTKIMLADWQAAVSSLEASGERFDLIFLDPPYAMRDLTGVTAALLPLMAEDARVIAEHQADAPYAVCDALERVDARRYGFVGVTIYRRKD